VRERESKREGEREKERDRERERQREKEREWEKGERGEREREKRERERKRKRERERENKYGVEGEELRRPERPCGFGANVVPPRQPHQINVDSRYMNEIIICLKRRRLVRTHHEMKWIKSNQISIDQIKFNLT
jgi:hypothetical protein